MAAARTAPPNSKNTADSPRQTAPYRCQMRPARRQTAPHYQKALPERRPAQSRPKPRPLKSPSPAGGSSNPASHGRWQTTPPAPPSKARSASADRRSGAATWPSFRIGENLTWSKFKPAPLNIRLIAFETLRFRPCGERLALGQKARMHCSKNYSKFQTN